MKDELRAYFGLKSIGGTIGGWKLRGLSTEQIWDKLQEEFEKERKLRETHSTSVSKTGVTSEKRHDPIVEDVVC